MSYRHPVCTLLFLLMGCASIQATDPQGLRVAACQILVDGDREATFKRIELALAAATADDADIACFPEACLLGWVNPTAHQIAGTIPGPSTERLGHLARKYRVMISLGLAEQRDGRLHNSAVLIGRDGTVLLTHRKRNILGE
ncbi:MAG: putative amidohydrolase, partial [Candidatus Paceibacteria bacterium]